MGAKVAAAAVAVVAAAVVAVAGEGAVEAPSTKTTKEGLPTIKGKVFAGTITSLARIIAAEPAKTAVAGQGTVPFTMHTCAMCS